MRKLRVGVWIIENYNLEAGGGFSYYDRLIENLRKYSFQNAEIIFISFKIDVNNFSGHKAFRISKLKSERIILKKIYQILYWFFLLSKIKIKSLDFKYRENKKVESKKMELSDVIDIIYYPTPHCPVTYFPYIYTLWDLGHVNTYPFPELSMNGAFGKRKKHHDDVPLRALSVFCESKYGKEEAARYLNLNPARISVIPMFASKIVEESVVAVSVNKLKGLKFIHYPAHYWAHKNHYTLLLAFREVICTNPDINLVFTGAEKGNKNYIINMVNELGLKNNVFDLGFVSIEELKWIYLNSIGLVMPTFLGPTNMPLLEAAELNCPVACSDLPGHREQLGDYALYFQPENSSSIKNAVLQLIDNFNNNEKRKYANIYNVTNSMKSIDDAFSGIRNIRFTWLNA